MKFAVFCLLLIPSFVFAGLVDPRLQNFARQPSGTQRVIVLMEVRPGGALPAASDRRGVFNYVVAQTQASWGLLLPSLQPAMQKRDVQVRSIHAISQSFAALVTPAGLRLLATLPGINKIYLDGAITVEPVLRRAIPMRLTPAGLPYDLTIIGMDQVYQNFPGLTGSGVLVGHIDTGVDGTHPALAGKIALFYDVSQKKIGAPIDSAQHGTHTAGTILGNPKDGVPMGMAPGAKLIAAAGLNNYDDMLNAMQFMLSPSGVQPSAVVPRLVSNSWNCDGAPDMEAFYRAINAWEAAGILTVFSAGNSGPGPGSITAPHEHPSSLSIGAYGVGGVIAEFSSRGPGQFNGQPTQKPDISGPGVDIISSVPGGGYMAMSGTSMSTPHVSGLAALMYQMDPTLTPAKVREILVKSSDFVDAQGQSMAQMAWNPNFGFGRMNAFKALNLLKTQQNSFVNRWGNFLAPSVGMNAFVRLDPNVGRPGLAYELNRTYLTDRRRWIEGSRL